MNFVTGKTTSIRAAEPGRKRARKAVKGASQEVSQEAAQEATHAAGGNDDLPDLTLTDRAYQQLEEMITTLVLPPGLVLGEQNLVQRLGIGRTPIREALQRLARDGLVVVMPRRGILVSDINVRSQLRLLETRRVLERLIARLAAERSTREEREVFAGLAQDMRDAAAASDDLAFMRLDRQFNELIATASRNEFAVRSLESMAGLSRRFWYQHYKQAADLPLTANLHADVCEAVARRDVEAAGAASDRLVDYIESFARKTLDL
ncbi:DNA-binding transcriptional regulator, GntR family [Methylobacterium sp. 275MFSha3.1]|uniref:GntR family transcriptional regulator n=1 Tax=Methylobacterium sp. 275MFSha3.1 TaxID=1502746 RepID=UPI0008A72488|nr:GntR family transcriptional regulator [Methylobacterium sp. 275MFSha3.1]SEI05103.1 DNA-binding transcriptional regulator, GntR family [Methylobacterium sp. 275MFSha3.1]